MVSKKQHYVVTTYIIHYNADSSDAVDSTKVSCLSFKSTCLYITLTVDRIHKRHPYYRLNGRPLLIKDMLKVPHGAVHVLHDRFPHFD